MTTKDILTFMTIHLFVPLVGLIYFVYLSIKIKRDKIEKPPIFELFIIFATYGGLFLVLLTALFWFWSGMASIGSFYLILVAPLIMGAIVYRQKKIKGNSKYHMWSYKAGLLYFIIAPITFLILFLVGNT